MHTDWAEGNEPASGRTLAKLRGIREAHDQEVRALRKAVVEMREHYKATLGDQPEMLEDAMLRLDALESKVLGILDALFQQYADASAVPSDDGASDRVA